MRVRSGRSGRLVGATVGGIFGAIWLIASANTPLGNEAAVAFRIIGIIAVVFLLVGRRRAGSQPSQHAGGVSLFGRAYWQIVAGEIAALAIGFAVFAAAGAPSQVYRPWTAIVIAVHFIAFHRAGVWPGSAVWPVLPLLAVGIAGFALAYTSDANWVSLVTGVGTGLILLGGTSRVMALELRASPAGALDARQRRPAQEGRDRVAGSRRHSAPAGSPKL
jgi:hypothetical protein